jgi:transcriptional regulator with XRE-family HTH domain
MSAYGDLVRDDRKAAGLTLRRLGELVGCDYTYLSRIERGRMVPARATAEIIAKRLGADVAQHLLALGWHACSNCGNEHRTSEAAWGQP